MEIIDSSEYISYEYLSKVGHSRMIDLYELNGYLISPDTRKGLSLVQEQGSLSLHDGVSYYPIKAGSPVLYPKIIMDEMIAGAEIDPQGGALAQYFRLSQIKQSGEVNAPSDSIPYGKHLYRMHEFCSTLKGMILDVGCDSPRLSSKIYPEGCSYIGLDPFTNSGDFRIIGSGEVLPIKDSSIDAVIFNTSLDHILDHHTAIDEAYRVIKPGGTVVISTFIWLEAATLLTDSVHFHHFREYEIMGALSRYENIIKKKYISPKGDRHRYGLYVKANKPFRAIG